MDLFEQVSNDIKEAMKARDKVRLMTIHAAKGFSALNGYEPHRYCDKPEEHKGDGRKRFLRFLAEEYVDKQNYYEYREH